MSSVRIEPGALPAKLWAAYTVPKCHPKLEDKLMARARAEGLLASDRSAPGGRPWLIPAAALIVVAALLVAIVVWLAKEDQSTIVTNEVKTPSTFRISLRVVAMADPGAVLGSQQGPDGLIRVQQEAGSVVYRSEGARLEISTPAGSVTVEGTCFRVQLAGEAPDAESASPALRVRVFSGQVVLGSGGQKLNLAADQTGTVEQAGATPQAGDEVPGEICPISDSLFASADASLTGPIAAQDPKASFAASEHLPPGKAAEDLIVDPVGELVLEGQVVDESGLPVAGAEVSIVSKPKRSTISATNGTFSFDRLTPRIYPVWAIKGTDVGGPFRHELTATSDPVVLRLHRANTVIVRVTDKSTKEPIAAAEVKTSGWYETTVLTNEDGVARFEGIPPPGRIFLVTASAYCPAGGYTRIPLVTGYLLEVEFLLKTGSRLTGRVLAGEGKPVVGARVVPKDADANMSSNGFWSEGAVTNANGTFSIPKLAAGRYRLTVTHPDHVTKSTDAIKMDGRRPVDGILIALDASSVVRGLVKDEQDRPVPWASIRVAPPLDAPKRSAGSAGGGTFKSEQATAAGTFELKGMPQERMALGAFSRAGVSKEVVIDLTGRTSIEGVELVLHPSARIAGQGGGRNRSRPAGSVCEGNGQPD